MYSPSDKKLVHLNDPETHSLGQKLKAFASLDFLGQEVSAEIAQKIAECAIDPQTHEPITTLAQVAAEKRELKPVTKKATQTRTLNKMVPPPIKSLQQFSFKHSAAAIPSDEPTEVKQMITGDTTTQKQESQLSQFFPDAKTQQSPTTNSLA